MSKQQPLGLFGEQAKLTDKKKSDSITLEKFIQTPKKVIKKIESKVEIKSNRVSSDILKPLSEEERKILFPNGAVSLKQLKHAKNTARSNVRD